MSFFGTDLFGGAVDTAATFSTNGYIFDRLPDTVSSNALQSMQPITSGSADNSWSGFWQDTAKGLISYAAAKDAAKVGANNAANYAAAQTQARTPVGGVVLPTNLLLMAAAGLAVFLVVR